MVSELAELEEENEAMRTKVSIAEQKALEAEAKRRYGKDWKSVLGGLGKFRSGIDWGAIKFKL